LKAKTIPTHILSGYIPALAATAIWSGNFIVARGLSGSIPPVSLAFWRWTVAALVFLPFALRSFISDLPAIRKNLPYLGITSFLGVTLFNTLIYFAGRTSTAINLSVISITFPLFIVVLARFVMKEKITLHKGIGILLVVSGVLLLITKGDLTRLLNLSFAVGDFWMLLAAITFAVYSILLKHKPRDIGVWSFQFSTFITGLLFLTPVFLWEQAITPPVEFNPAILFSILYIGIFASLCAFVLWNKAVISIGPAKAGMVYYTLPIFSAASAYFILGETLRWYHPVSFLIIVPGILIANYKTREETTAR